MASTAIDRPTTADAAAGGMALLIVDMISDWRFADAQKLLPAALAIAPSIARFKARCARAGVPTIYANDNQGRWHSDFHALVGLSLEAGGPASSITQALQPQPQDFFVLKPKHSAFHATPLALLLEHLKVSTLVVAGVSSDQCVMSTVLEARMKNFDVVVPRDLVGSQGHARNDAALRQFAHTHELATPSSVRLRLPSASASRSRSRERAR